MSHGKRHFFLSGEASQGSVCYQRGLPRLVLHDPNISLAMGLVPLFRNLRGYLNEKIPKYVSAMQCNAMV